MPAVILSCLQRGRRCGTARVAGTDAAPCRLGRCTMVIELQPLQLLLVLLQL